MSPLDPKTLESLRGYLNVAYRLGLLLAQVDHCPPTTCRLSYKGEVAKKDTRLLSAAFAAGLLEHAMAQGVNIVNAEVLLRERGIELVEQRTVEIGDFSSLITAEVISEEKTSTAAGTLFGNNMPRLVQKGGCRLESFLDGTLMIFVHRDTPGVIGRVGSIFGRASGQYRPDVRRPPDEPTGRRSRGGAGLGLRAPGRSPGRDRRPAAHHPGVRRQVASRGRNAPMDGWVRGDCPDFRVNENGTVPFEAGTVLVDTKISTGPVRGPRA